MNKKILKVVLISTDENKFALGSRTLSSHLKENGIDSTLVIMDTEKESFHAFCWEDLYKICDGADLIGLSCMTHGLRKAIEIKNALKKMLPPIVIGGIHASLDPGSLTGEFDIVCHGEGEDALLELSKRIEAGIEYFDIPGLWISTGKEIIKNSCIPLKKNLNDYPIPDYDFKKQFILEGQRLVTLGDSNIPTEDFVILGSRGCPHNCSYCSNQKLKQDFHWRKIPIHYSIDYLIEHIKAVCKVHPSVKSFWLEDDTFFSKSSEEIKEFSSRYKKEINKPFQILISPWTYKEEKLAHLIEAGMNKLIMGIQSGCEEVNKNIYDRKITSKRIYDITVSLNKYSSMCKYYDFIGMNPFETADNLLDTIEFVKKMPPPFVLYNNNLAFYPGTSLYNRAIKEGLDVSRRIRHSEISIGYKILREENINCKLLHLVFLLMAGHVNSYMIGSIPRIFVARPFLYIYKTVTTQLKIISDPFVKLLCIILPVLQWRKVLRTILRPRLYNKLKVIRENIRG
jgi:radical SAM superfamily enzyme YgiQ (UPF0313 family)